MSHVKPNNLKEPVFCSECHNDYVTFDSFKNGYKTFCSVSCSRKNKSTQEKYKKTMIDIYGVDNPIKSKKIQEKIKKTNLEKYGNKHAMQNKNIQEKVKKTNLKKYGVENVFQNKNIQEKQKETLNKKYGENIENISQIEQVKNKKKNTVFKNIFSNKIKSFEKNIKVKALFDLKEYKGVTFKYKWKCLKCSNIYLSNLDDGKIPLCPRCNYSISNSNQEKEVIDFIKKNYNGFVDENNRQLIKPYEVDAYIKDLNIAFEYNGIYYHRYSYLIEKKNDKEFQKYNFSNKGIYYHLLKTKKAEEKNVQLIHIFEDEWLFKKEIVKSIIKYKLKITDINLNARDCEIKEVNSNEKNIFLEENHLQGQDNSKIKLGLYLKKNIQKNNIFLNKGTLISLMTFGKPRYDKNSKWEIYRFCNLLNSNIRGSAQKLFKYFLKNYKKENESIITYADKRYSNGDLYYNLGFIKTHESKPNYFYIKNQKRYSRIKFQKKEIKKLFENKNNNEINVFDEKLSEWDNMQMNKFDKIYDCGNIAFKLE